MKVFELQEKLNLTPFAAPDPERPVMGGYAGDLLSWVMGRAGADEAWITIMSNMNIVAVATLADVSLVILSEGVTPDQGVAQMAEARGVNLYGSSETTFELCAKISGLIGT